VKYKPAFILVITVLVFLPLFQALAFCAPRASRLIVLQELEQASGKTIGTYRALIIGINDYKDNEIPDLKTAVNDARELAEILRKDYWFSDVTLLLDDQANSSRIHRSLRKLAAQSNKNDSVLIYYAGHGELDKLTKAGYWVPHDARAGDPATYLHNGIIQTYIKAIPARHVLLVADSCFSGTLFGEARALPPIIDDKFYATLFKEKSRWGMTSGNLTPVSDEGSGGHSIFAYQFLKTLKENEKPYLTPRDIYQKIGPIIRNNSEQMPITKPIKNTGDEGGEFVFIRVTIETKISVETQSSPAPPSNQLDDGREALDKERKELEAERLRIEAERRKIQEEQRLAEEKRKLVEEKRKLEEEKQRLKEEQKKTQTARLDPGATKAPKKQKKPWARPRDRVVLTIKEIAVRPVKTDSHDSQTNEQIQNGSQVDLVLVYDLTSPNEGEQFELKEVRALYKVNSEGVKQLLFEHPVTAMSEQGEMETYVRYAIPPDAQEGYYTFQVSLELAGRQYTQTKDFYIFHR